MVQPIHVIFRYLQTKTPVQIWLFEQLNTRMEGVIIGMDEFMNLVLDDAYEVARKSGERKPLGRILLKGDCISLLRAASS